MAKAFLDSNVVLYAFTDDPRSIVAERLLSAGCDISVQVLNEFANVARRKLGMGWSDTEAALGAIRTLARAIHPIDLETHTTALALAQRYRLSFYDALIAASALKARCEVLHSEDMQDSLVIEGRLKIANPFVDPAQ